MGREPGNHALQPSDSVGPNCRMRIVIFGAGAVGSVIGGRLSQHAAAHGHDVTLVARGSHCDAIRASGLTINDPAGTTTVQVPVAERIDHVALDAGDVVLLTMKGQDTPAALEQLAQHAPNSINVVCAQNGVENERLALRRFGNVYGMCVMLPATFMEPGVVDAHGAPHNAILDVGRYPAGTDATSEAIAAALDGQRAGQSIEPRRDAMEVLEVDDEPAQRGRRARQRCRERARSAAVGTSTRQTPACPPRASTESPTTRIDRGGRG